MKVNRQKTLFLRTEGDGYFERNRAIAEPAYGFRLAESYVREGSRVLEIGCSNGRNLAWLKGQKGIKAAGIDPSKKAIAAGRREFGEVGLKVGTADSLPYPDDCFDMVVFGFCLYLIDRHLLMRSIAEADRVLTDGGVIVITDFEPKIPTRRPYRHVSNMYSYKLDYASLFLIYPQYVLVEKHHYSHRGAMFVVEPGERVSTSIIVKDMEHAYVCEEDAPPTHLIR